MPVDIRGTMYSTVAERLKMAHGDDPAPVGIQSVHTEVYGVGEIVVVKATVTFQDGRTFCGHSMVNSNSRSPAERDAPLETCETSAVGRALAMSGYPGSEKGLAGAEELELAERRNRRYADGSTDTTRVIREGQGTAAPRPVGLPGPLAGGPSPAQVRYLAKLWGDAGRPFPPPEAEGMSKAEVSRIIDELKAELGVPSGRPV